MDRRLFEEPPIISSTLRWEDVVLPNSVSEAEIDQIIFAEMTSQSRKTALIISKALARCEAIGLPIDADMLGARLEALAEASQIDSAGDLRKWRHSEVRLRSAGSRDLK
jgi:uncharacterized protein DUF3658